MTETQGDLVVEKADILVVDDDDQVRNMLCEMLTCEGYEVMSACDGAEAIAKLREKGAILVITDIIMPNQEGIETIRILQSDFPGTKIIAISGGGRLGPNTFLPTAEKFGADRVFEKPFDFDEMMGAVKELVAGCEPRAPLPRQGSRIAR